MVPGTRRRASSTNPETWRTYREATGALKACPNRYAGVGRVIRHGEGLVGIDLDGVRDPATRVIDPWALEILESLDSYAEVSPSGRGVKVWVRARLDRSYVKDGCEVYTRGRYFVTTGQLIPRYSPTVQERQEEVLSLVKRAFPTPGRGASVVTGGPYHGPDIALGTFLDGVEVLAEVRDDLGIKFSIICPWIRDHTAGDESGTYVGQRTEGPLWFHCHHAHCAGRGWRDFKREIIRRSRSFMRLERGGLTIQLEVKSRD